MTASSPYIIELTEETCNFPIAKRVIKAGHDDVVFEANKYFTFTGTIDGKDTNQKQLVPAADMKFTAVEEPVHPYRAMLQTSRSDTEFQGILIEDISVLNDATDNVTTLKAAHEKIANVTLKGTTFHKDGNWHTLYLPFALDSLKGTPLEGAEIRKMTNANYIDNVLSLYYVKHEGTIYYGYPYIFRFAEEGEDIDNPCFELVSVRPGRLVLSQKLRRREYLWLLRCRNHQQQRPFRALPRRREHVLQSRNERQP